MGMWGSRQTARIYNRIQVGRLGQTVIVVTGDSQEASGPPYPQSTERQRIGNQIDATMIFSQSHFVNVYPRSLGVVEEKTNRRFTWPPFSGVAENRSCKDNDFP